MHLFRKSPYSGRIQENTDQKDSVFGHISRGVRRYMCFYFCLNTTPKKISLYI